MGKLGSSLWMEAVEEYSIHRTNDKRLSVVINQGLNIFLQFSDLIYSSLFLLNDETYEFDQSLTIPSEFSSSVNGVFQQLVDKQIVGSALTTKSMSYFKDDKSSDNLVHYLVYPLIGSNGPLGLVILNISKSPEEMDHDFFMMCNIQTSLYASTIENAFLHLKGERIKEDLDQLVAYRTLNLIERQKQLNEKFEDLRSNLSMSMPHEVRTPINQILGTTDYLIKNFTTTDKTETEEMLRDVHSSTYRLKRLFENYLYFANLSLIATNIYEIMNIQKLVTPSSTAVLYDSVMSKADELERRSDITLNIEDVSIQGSEEFFKKLIDELIDNALKYSDSGTSIDIEGKKENEEWFVITIHDNGRGMAQEQINNIDPYVQFDRKVFEQQGSGLGLSIVRRIVDIQNGEFSIESEKGKYTKVTVKLPIAKDFDPSL